MKRVFRKVLLGAVSYAATISVGGGAYVIGSQSAFAQDASSPDAPTKPASGRAARAPSNTHAQVSNPNQVVQRILVEGNQRVESSTVISYLLIQPGATFDPERIDLSLKTLFATGLFADVQIVQRDADLVVRVVENPIISEVKFEGTHALKIDDLKKEVQAKPRGVFTAARAQADVQRIIELYRRSGRFAAQVTPQVKELDQNRVELIFKIDEGPKTGVRSINFIGNRAYSAKELRDAIKTEQSRWWKFLSSNDNYDPDRIEYDRELLRQYYTGRGYADFKIVSAVAQLTPDQKDFYLTFTIDEGPRYQFGDISVDAQLDKLSAKLLKAAIPIEPGARFDGSLVEKSIDSLTFVAGTAGYANVDIRPRVERDLEHKKVNITFEVNEGPRVYVDRIDVTGNTRTVDPVIRREIRLSEGDAFNRVLLDRSKTRLKALGFFKNVDIDDKPGSQPDRSVVEVKVEEESTGELSFAAGYSTTDSLVFDASVSERNLRGRGDYLRLRASTSKTQKQLDLRFTEPRFLGRNIAAGFDLFSLNTDFLTQSGFQNQATGASLRTSFPLTDTTSLGLTYTIRDDTTKIQSSLCDPTITPSTPTVCGEGGSFLSSVASYALNWDQRNDPIKPTNGFDLTVRQDFAGLGGQIKYLRTELVGALYKGLMKDVTASLSFNAGYVYGWGGDDVRLNDRFFKGAQSFRGFNVAGVGPHQITTQVNNTTPGSPITTTTVGGGIGGNVYAIGTAQLEIPLGLPKEFGLSGALFSDFGTVGQVDKRFRQPVVTTIGASTFTSTVQDDLNMRASAGLSIFWDSPFGPVEFDLADPFLKNTYDKTQTFRFSTRTQF